MRLRQEPIKPQQARHKPIVFRSPSLSILLDSKRYVFSANVSCDDIEQFLWCDPQGFEKRLINEVKGFGLVATRLFRKGEFLLFYRGERLTEAVYNKRLDVSDATISSCLTSLNSQGIQVVFRRGMSTCLRTWSPCFWMLLMRVVASLATSTMMKDHQMQKPRCTKMPVSFSSSMSFIEVEGPKKLTLRSDFRWNHSSEVCRDKRHFEGRRGDVQLQWHQFGVEVQKENRVSLNFQTDSRFSLQKKRFVLMYYLNRFYRPKILGSPDIIPQR